MADVALMLNPELDENSTIKDAENVLKFEQKLSNVIIRYNMIILIILIIWYII